MVFLILLPWCCSNKKQVAETSIYSVVIFQCHDYQRYCLFIDSIHDIHFEEEHFKVVRLVLSLSYHRDSLVKKELFVAFYSLMIFPKTYYQLIILLKISIFQKGKIK